MTTMTQSSNERWVWILAAVIAATFFVSRSLELVWLNVILKPLPLVALWYLVTRWSQERFAKIIGVGFGFSALGDVLLEYPADLFVFGSVIPDCAPLLHCRLPSPLDRVEAATALPFIAWCGGMFVWMRNPGEMMLPVGIYVTVIAVMLWRAAATFVQGDGSGRWALVGAVVFAISDSLLAVNRFIDPFVGAAYLVMVTYWGGQLCLALSTRPQWKKMKVN